MTRNIFVGSLLLLLTIGGCSGTKTTTEAPSQKVITDTDALLEYQDEITVDYLRQHLTVFSSDSMEGRATGMKGQKIAANYLVNQYKNMGLKAVGDNGSYLQKLKLKATQSDSIVFTTFTREAEQKQTADRSVISKNSTADFIQQFSRGDTLSGDIIFAGYGLQNSALGIDQLQQADFEGKWVMIFNEVPQVVKGDTLYKSKRSFYRKRVSGIIQKGAKGILMIPQMSAQEFSNRAKKENMGFGKPSGLKLAYLDKNTGSLPSLALITIAPPKAADLLGLADTGALDEKRREILQNMDDFQAQKTKYGLSQITYEENIELGTENVLAFLEGGDPKLKDEVVIMSSHYDHLGIGAPDSTGDRIYNGADDDGSGVIGTLNTAKAFVEAAKDGVRPKRSVLFLNVTGEEKGLLGSRYYSDHPVFPIDKTVANLNIDMIGRIDPEHEKKGVEDYSYIIGSELISSGLDSLLKVANSQSGQIELNKKYNDLEDPNQFYRRSDHWNFGRLGIPFVFFFTGVHEDYHRPSDEVEKIRFEKMAKIVRTMYATIVMVANADEAPKVDNQAFIEITKGG